MLAAMIRFWRSFSLSVDGADDVLSDVGGRFAARAAPRFDVGGEIGRGDRLRRGRLRAGRGAIAGVSGACLGTVMTGGGDGRRASGLDGAASRSGGRNATFGSGGGGGEGMLPGVAGLRHELDGERAAGVAFVRLRRRQEPHVRQVMSTAPAHGRAATPRTPPGSRRFVRRRVARPAGGARISSATQRGHRHLELGNANRHGRSSARAVGTPRKANAAGEYTLAHRRSSRERELH